MGVDVFGKVGNAEYEEDSRLFDEIGAEEHMKLAPGDRPWDCTKPGRYFQTSWWTWRPLARFMCKHFPEITSHCTYWQSNDGDGLDATMAVRLADAIDAMVESGEAADAIEKRMAGLRALPHRRCDLCHGSGVRADSIADEVDAHQRQRQRDMTIPDDAVWATGCGQTLEHPRAGATGWCNGCDGRGLRRPRECSHTFTLDDLKRFAHFARHSGGFEIS